MGVYVVSFPRWPQFAKVGCSDAPSRRIRVVSRALDAGFPVRVLRLEPCWGRDEEAQMHRALRPWCSVDATEYGSSLEWYLMLNGFWEAVAGFRPSRDPMDGRRRLINRLITTNGYYALFMPENPMALKNGYVYEHRTVAAQKIGRPLLPDEQVHHVDGDRLNNDAENLEVLSDAAHRLAHRLPGCARRLPGQENPVVGCACGCGAALSRFDGDGRPRGYVSGHNRNASNTKGFRNPKKGVRHPHG